MIQRVTNSGVIPRAHLHSKSGSDEFTAEVQNDSQSGWMSLPAAASLHNYDICRIHIRSQTASQPVQENKRACPAQNRSVKLK